VTSQHGLYYKNMIIKYNRSQTLTKIIGKVGEKAENFPQFSQNETIFVKIGESNFLKMRIFLSKLANNSPNFPMIFVSEVAVKAL